MPREHQKRGRREQQKKRKLADDDTEAEHLQKRQNTGIEQDQGQEYNHGTIAGTFDETSGPDTEKPFFGLLDEQEQEYFKRADDLLEYNQFEGPEERALFLANVYKEAEGKELRLANSQSCSRLLERLILLSTPEQLKNLFQKFSGNFLHLVQHRFASHCCEGLFIKAAPVVTEELANGMTTLTSDDPNAVIESMENLFLHTLNELESQVSFLMTDRFGSHALRVLLVVLSGNPLKLPGGKDVIRSKKKESVKVVGGEKEPRDVLESRAVPQSFGQALENLIDSCVSSLDTTTTRALATHSIGSPVLQVLLHIEMQWYGKQRGRDDKSLLNKLIATEAGPSEAGGTDFINSLAYDTTGSHLLEVIIQSAPGKLFKSLYKRYFKERLPLMMRNTTAGYVCCKVLERLGKDDLSDVLNDILPKVADLLARNRTVVLKSLVESCGTRGVATDALASALQSTPGKGFDIARLLQFDEPAAPSVTIDEAPASPAEQKRHYSMLAQSLLKVEGPLSAMVFEGLQETDADIMLKVASDPAGTYLVQAAILSPSATVIIRRRLMQTFYGHMGAMATDVYASHVVDAIWQGTSGLAFIRERFAEELAENEASLRESPCGRHVWRLWEMDLWKRHRSEWVRKSREAVGSQGFPGWPEESLLGQQKSKSGTQVDNGAKQKTPLELAREKHAAKKAGKVFAPQTRESKLRNPTDLARERHFAKVGRGKTELRDGAGGSGPGSKTTKDITSGSVPLATRV